MRFGEFSLYDATGVELTAPVKCSGRLLKAGHILDSSDIADLRAAGIKKVVGAQFDAADIKPETAADILLNEGDTVEVAQVSTTDSLHILSQTGAWVFGGES